MFNKGLTRRQLLGLSGGTLVFHNSRLAIANCRDGKTLQIRRATNFQTFDPADTGGEDEVITRNILAPLVRYRKRASDDEPWQWEKHLAIVIKKIDERSYDFELRHNKTWTSGGDVSAQDVKFSFERIAGLTNNKISAKNSSLWNKLKEVRALDSYSGRIFSEEDHNDLIKDILPKGVGCIVHQGTGSVSWECFCLLNRH
jgi:peptide/nickel transport system substrate-binding protein